MLNHYLRSVYFLVISFAVLFIAYFMMSERYIYNSEKNYTNAIKNEIENFISTREEDAYMIAKNFALNKKLIKALKSKRYKYLNTKNFFKIPKNYFDYNDFRIQIVDRKGKRVYISWNKEDEDENITNTLQDLKELFQNPHPKKEILVKNNNILFTGIVPIYDSKHQFLGIVEAFASFGKIYDKLKQENIKSAVIIDKNLLKQNGSKECMTAKNGYRIIHSIDKDILKLIETYSIPYLVNIKDYDYIFKKDSLIDGYYIVNVPI
ncbi:MAG: hypothetical protein GXO12_00745, partial [Epsilonproteobacteria bacterium]|nr:hypothetical protein [Campylobacterota bacterium]